MKALFDTIATAQPALQGWCSEEKAATLASIIVSMRPSVSLEIGVFGGSSLLPIALAHKQVGKGLVVGVDPWDRATAVAAQVDQESREWWDKLDYEGLFNGVREMVERHGLKDYCRLVRKKSSLIDVPPGIGLLHIDGAHNDEAVRDVVRFCQHVEVGGYTVMDDLNWQGGGPARAALRLTQMGYRKLYDLGTGAVFQRIR